MKKEKFFVLAEWIMSFHNRIPHHLNPIFTEVSPNTCFVFTSKQLIMCCLRISWLIMKKSSTLNPLIPFINRLKQEQTLLETTLTSAKSLSYKLSMRNKNSIMLTSVTLAKIMMGATLQLQTKYCSFVKILKNRLLFVIIIHTMPWESWSILNLMGKNS